MISILYKADPKPDPDFQNQQTPSLQKKNGPYAKLIFDGILYKADPDPHPDLQKS